MFSTMLPRAVGNLLCACSLVVGLSQLTDRSRGGVYSLPATYSSLSGNDLYYTVDLSFNGQELPVLLDTGSGDLLVVGSDCNVVDELSGCYLTRPFDIKKTTRMTDENFGTVVGLGSITGPNALLEVDGDGYTLAKDFAVPLINVSNTQGEFQDGQFSGIFGLNTRNISRNWYFNERMPLIDTMISKGQLAKPLFSLTLPRLADPESQTGALTLGGIEDIPAAKQMTYAEIVDTVNFNYDPPVEAPQGWTAVLTGIRVNGHEIEVTKGEIDPAGRYLALMDSGSSVLRFRRPEFEKITLAFNGHTIIDYDQDIYFECGIPQLIELKFHDRWFPIDPLDMIVSTDHSLVNGTAMCHAPLGTWDREFGDAIVGPTFLRNVLSVYDYVSAPTLSEQPRLGLASVTNAAFALKRYTSLYQHRLA